MPTVVRAVDRSSSRNARKAAISGFFGSALEYYDFFIYGAAAALVFNDLFFPAGGGAQNTLLSISTFGVAYIARPLGAVLWGHLGDRIGRRKTLITVIALMGIATFAIGCLPTYEQVGIAAPLLLVGMRLLQGLSAGGESPGSIALTVEHSPMGRRGLFASFTISGIQFGIVLSSLVFVPISALPREDLLSWGWRVPFLLSFVVTVAVLVLRRTLEEPDTFAELERNEEKATIPALELIRTNWRTIVRIVCSSVFLVMGTIINVFALSFATQAKGIAPATMLIAIAVANAFSVPTHILAGWLSDRFGRKPIYLIGLAGIGPMAFALFAAIEAENVVLIFVSVAVLLGIFVTLPDGTYPAYFPEQFPAKIRYSGVAIGLMVALLLAGFAPALAQALSGGDVANWAPVAWMCTGCALVSAIAVLCGPETYRTPADELGKPRG